MRVLLDHCVDIHFAKLLVGHDVAHTKTLGWQQLSNGKLLSAAEEAGFQVLVTVDKNVRFQQNIAKRQISLITLNPRFVDYDQLVPMVDALLAILESGLPSGSQILIEP